MYRANNPSAPGMNSYCSAPSDPQYPDNNYSSPQTSQSDSHTRVTYRDDTSAASPGYFQRVGSSLCGIGIGFMILIASFPVLFMNEGRAVRTARSLDEGLKMVIPLSDVGTSYESNNNKLIHLSGKITTELALTDNDFGIRVHATHLKRHVEMYQWLEKEHKREYKEGDRVRVETTYSYSREWRSEIVKSDRFDNPHNHRNPTSFPVSKYVKSADPVRVGIFQLSPKLKSAIGNYKKIVPRSKPAARDDLVILEHYFYRSRDPYNVQVGDLRISFSYAGLSTSDESDLGPAHEVSVVARQNGVFLSSFKTEAGDVLELLYSGIMSAKDIFDSEHATNTMFTWLLRGVGWLMMFISFQIMMDILRQLVSFIPIVRDVVGLATSILAFTFATSLSLTVIAIGWFVYRPMVSLAIFAAAAVPFYLSRRKANVGKVMKE